MEGSRLIPGQPLRLADIEAPLEPVEFPDGTIFRVQPYGPEQYAMYRSILRKWDPEVASNLLKYVVPDATPADLDTLSPRMMWVLLEHAQFKIEVVMYALKNAEAGKKAKKSSSPHSKQKTPKDSSSRKSREESPD